MLAIARTLEASPGGRSHAGNLPTTGRQLKIKRSGKIKGRLTP
jgi:hypothetical protein